MKRLLGEYETQKTVCVLFPYRTDVWRAEALPAQKMIIELVNTMSKYEKVILGVLPSLTDYVKNNFIVSDNVEILPVKYNDSWARDTISSVLCDGEKRFVNAFAFNSYGMPLYTPFNDDQKLNDAVLSAKMGYEVENIPLVLEWGNLATDGNGTLFAVEPSIVNDNRNPGISRKTAEEILLEKTCSKQIHWLPYGLDFDETGGHIDNILAFANDRTMLISYTEDQSNPHYKKTHELYKLLEGVTNASGQPYQLVKLPIPAPHVRSTNDSLNIVENQESYSRLEGDTVLYTYVNFVIINGAVIMPAFGLPQDDEAREILKKVFPDRDIILLNAHEAFLGGGGFHCLTKHIN